MNRAEWIWYPDDFEIELSGKFMAERYERDIVIPPFWKLASCYRNVKFLKRVHLKQAERVKIFAEGVFNIAIDGGYLYSVTTEFTVPAGEHELLISVYNGAGLPCLKLEGESVNTDESWLVTANDHIYKKAACDGEFLKDKSPNCFSLPSKERLPVATVETSDGVIYDFGEEMFARVKLFGARLSEGARIYYGESLEEARDIGECELLSEDFVVCDGYVTVKIAKAFRYINLRNIEFESIAVDEELSPSVCKGSFECDDPLLNEIYKVSKRTLELCSREFLLDGIKRDRWLWCADVYQASLMHYYSFFDAKSIKRSMIALFGKSPFDLYVNHIMDYTFFWIICFDDYYRHTGDREFIGDNCYKIFEIMDHCLGRRDADGLMDSRPEDWVFVDWADLDNSGEVCCEQMLLVVSLQRCIKLAEEFGYSDKAVEYGRICEETKEKLEKFWLKDQNAYTYSYKNGEPDGKILMQPNIFAVLFDLCDDERKELIKKNVLKNPHVPKIVTPYMRFYELSALCRLRETEYVVQEIRSYWGAMIDEGTTTFWERYDTSVKGVEKYAMYGRKYGKSLCHAWGATPLYLLGRYIVGLKATENAEGFTLKPSLSGLKLFKAEMPLVKGTVKVEVDENRIRVFSSELPGTLIVDEKEYVIFPGEESIVTL